MPDPTILVPAGLAPDSAGTHLLPPVPGTQTHLSGLVASSSSSPSSDPYLALLAGGSGTSVTPRHAEYDYQAHSTDLRTLMALFTPAASAATMTMPPVPGTGGTAMPGMRFLSSDTAIMTTPANAAILASIAAAITDEAADAGQNTAPDAKSQEMGAYPVAPSGQSGQGTAGVQPHAAVVLDYEENGFFRTFRDDVF